MKTPIVVLREVEDKICELIRNNRVDEAVETIISYLAKHRVVVYGKPSVVIYEFDIIQRPVVTLLFSNFAVYIKESRIYIKPIISLETIVKLPFEA